MFIVWAVAVAALTAALADWPVSRKRVERFACRHDLEITPDNGRQIIAYLATTRRWRAAGAAGGLTAYAVTALQHDRIGVNLVNLLTGWFLGALAAEARAVGLLPGRRAASLIPRTLDRYVSGPARWALPASVIAFLAVAAVGGPRRALIPTVLVLLVSVAVWLVDRHVLRRSQPLAGADRLAADDAIRSRSLHGLTAAATGLVLYCALAVAPQLTVLAVPLGLIAVPLTCWRLATRRWVVPRPAAA
jgi:hypothetical protein